jgi:hypothetical protein
LRKLILLAMLLPLAAGCQLNKTNLTGTTANSRPPVCTVWRGVSYSAKLDTPQTVAEIRVNNAKRGAYCK